MLFARKLPVYLRGLTMVLALVVACLDPALADKRVALVVGNSNYANVAPLANPRNDASDMIARLRALGFDVVEGLDLDRSGLFNRLLTFGRAAENADVALFFYAGHGLQVNGQNYLVPTDARVEYEAELDLALVPMPLVMQQLARGSRVNIVLLDACRDNPFAKDLSRTLGTRSSSALGRGLSRVQSASGTFIAFATQPDNVAQDGDGRNSPFTRALLANLDKPNISLSDLMIDVRNEVMRQTGGKQIPWDSSSLTGRFSFKIEGTVTIGPQAAPAPAPVVPSAPAVDPRTLELGVWNAIQQSRDPAAFERFLREYPDGLFAPLAREKIAALQRPEAPVAALPVAPAAASIVLPARSVDFGRSVNIEVGGSVAAQYGADVMHNAPPYTLRRNAAEWIFSAPAAGRYRLEVEYAAQESRPVNVLVNGRVVLSNALAATTGGWGVAQQAFRPQGSVDLKVGENRIRFESASVFPHIRTLRLTPEASPVAALSTTGVLGGQWRTNWGTIDFTARGGDFVGRYALRNGALTLAAAADGSARGFWTQDLSDEPCDTARDGNRHWGVVSLRFAEHSFAGKWDYCDRANPGRTLLGVKVDPGGATGTPARVEGDWTSNWGRMRLARTGATVNGQFELRDGRLNGTLGGRVFDGYWTQSTSDRPCPNSRDGRRAWGGIRMYFDENTFVSEWGYCDGPLNRVNFYGER